MGLFKTDQEKAAAKARKLEAKAAAEAQKEHDRFLRSPIGMATQAHVRGDSLLQIAFPVDIDGGRILSEVEAIGWRLDQAGYAYELRLSSSSNLDEKLSSIESDGDITGVYLFRRA